MTLQYDVTASRNSRDDDLVFIDRPLEKIDERHESESETEEVKLECDDETQGSTALEKVDEEEVEAVDVEKTERMEVKVPQLQDGEKQADDKKLRPSIR